MFHPGSVVNHPLCTLCNWIARLSQRRQSTHTQHPNENITNYTTSSSPLQNHNMADVEKGFVATPNMPPPAYQTGSTGGNFSNFGGDYEYFVNDNMQSMTGAPIKKIDNAELPARSRFGNKKRPIALFAAGALLILALALIGVFVLGRQHDERDHGTPKPRPAVTITETTTQSSTSSSSTGVSTITTTASAPATTILIPTPSVRDRASLENPTSILYGASAYFSMHSQDAATITDARSVLDAASSYWSMQRDSFTASLASEASSREAAGLTTTTTTTPTATLTTAAFAAPVAAIPTEAVAEEKTLEPSPEPTTDAEPTPRAADPTPTPTLTGGWVGFCGVPGQACG